MSKKEARADWLDEHDTTEEEVFIDSEGREYITVIEENGTAGDDDYEVGEKIIHLPEELAN